MASLQFCGIEVIAVGGLKAIVILYYFCIYITLPYNANSLESKTSAAELIIAILDPIQLVSS